MKFSILMPVYNAEKYLHSSVQSVLDQSYKDFELVLVDDGSEDSSPRLCDEYKKKYPDNVQVIHQENKGQLITRCNAIKASTGDYCLFLDSDDLLVPDALKTLAERITVHNEPDMIIYSFYYDYGGGKLEKAKPLYLKEVVFEGESKKNLYKTFFTDTKLNNVWTKAVKRNVFDGEYPDFEKYSDLRCSEDRLHSMAMLSNADKVVYINIPLYKYRLVEGSVTRQFSVEAVNRFNTKTLYSEEQKYLIQWNLEQPEYQNRMDASWLSQVLYVFDLFYNRVKSFSDRSKLLRYNWTEFVPEDLLTKIYENPYLNKTQKQCWFWIINKNYCKLRVYYLKKKIYKILRNIKRKLLK